MKAVILLSGGLDSCVILAMALEKGRECHAISFDYGQRHKIELESAKAITKYYQVSHRIIQIDPTTFSNSALVSGSSIPKNRTSQEIAKGGIPNTYVPARNTLFLAYALGQAEILEAQEIYAGPNALDSLPYPDCRPQFIESFQALINVATKQAIEGNPPRLLTPLIDWDKAKIIKHGLMIHAPLELTMSCYDPSPQGKICSVCDACILREEGFKQARSQFC